MTAPRPARRTAPLAAQLAADAAAVSARLAPVLAAIHRRLAAEARERGEPPPGDLAPPPRDGAATAAD